MARSPHLRLWAVALWAMCLVGAGAGHAYGGDQPASGETPFAAISVLHPSADPAVLPARAAEELRTATQLVPLRTLLVGGMLAALVGLLAAVWQRSLRPEGGGRAPLARRHAIRLRAPPRPRFA